MFLKFWDRGWGKGVGEGDKKNFNLVLFSTSDLIKIIFPVIAETNIYKSTELT